MQNPSWNVMMIVNQSFFIVFVFRVVGDFRGITSRSRRPLERLNLFRSRLRRSPHLLRSFEIRSDAMLLAPLPELGRCRCSAVGPPDRPPHEPLDPVRVQLPTNLIVQIPGAFRVVPSFR